MNFITTQTKIFGSFSESPGNNGTAFFNSAFQRNKVNAVYLPVKCDSTENAIDVMRIMNFQGASFSKPHKISIMHLLDEVDITARKIGAVNTVVHLDGKLIGYNTDWLGVHAILADVQPRHLYIYGKGGFSKAVQFACEKLQIDFYVLGRNESIPDNAIIFNATPVDITAQKSTILDGRPFTVIGKKIFTEQAKYQYNLYTGMSYE